MEDPTPEWPPDLQDGPRIGLAEAAARGLQVEFRCGRCGQISSRPAAHLVRRWAVATLDQLQARASCLAHPGGRRCGGRGAVGYAAPPPGPAPESARL